MVLTPSPSGDLSDWVLSRGLAGDKRVSMTDFSSHFVFFKILCGTVSPPSYSYILQSI